MSSNNHRISKPLIIGHYGGCNTGDEAMLAGLLGAVDSELRRKAAVVVKESVHEGSYNTFGTTLVPADLASVFRALLQTDGLVLGGGTHFHDDYTTLRYIRHCRHMLRIVGLSILAKLFGRKVTWLGMGFGPFFRWPTEWVTRLGLKFCDHVTVRDAKSHEEISRWISPRKAGLAFDLSALMVGNSHAKILRPRDTEFACRILGVSVTSLRNCMTSGPRVDAGLRRSLATALSRILDTKPDLRIRVMVIRGGSWEDDGVVSRELHRIISRAHPGRCELVPYNLDPVETLRQIVDCDAFLATRYHACMFSYLAGCRLLFLSYHRKVRDLAREIGLSGDACVDVEEGVEEDLLKDRIQRMIDGDNAFKARLSVTDAALRAKRSIQVLQEC